MTNNSGQATGRPNRLLVLGSLAVVIAGWLIALLIQQWVDEPVLKVQEGFSTFAAFYIVAQALERFLEPIALYVHGDELVELKAKLKEEAGSTGQPDTATRKTFAELRSNRQIGFFALATLLATLTSGLLGLYMLQGVFEVENPPSWLNSFDVLFSGLVIGAGTKPLHDLIKRIEKAKENADPET